MKTMTTMMKAIYVIVWNIHSYLLHIHCDINYSCICGQCAEAECLLLS